MATAAASVSAVFGVVICSVPENNDKGLLDSAAFAGVPWLAPSSISGGGLQGLSHGIVWIWDLDRTTSPSSGAALTRETQPSLRPEVYLGSHSI